MAMSASALITDFTGLWTAPFPQTRSYQDTADAIEALWRTSIVGGGGGLSTAVVFTPGITYGPLSPVGGFISPAQTAAAFEAACQAMVLATIYTPIPSAVITPPPTPVTATPGTLIAALLPVFTGPSASTTASGQAALAGAAIHAYLTGWQISVTVAPAAPVLVPIF